MSPLLRALVVVSAACALVVPLAACGSGSGSAEAQGTLRVTEATVEVPPNPQIAAVRFVVDNGAATDDTLVGVSSPEAGAVAIHRSGVDAAGRATMVEVERLEIPARSRVTFEPGGLHVMLTGVRRSLRVGQTIPIRLTFAEAGTRTVRVEVIEPGTTPSGVEDAAALEHTDAS